MQIPYAMKQTSIGNKKDEVIKNGDFILTKYIDNEDLLFLSLADGVGSTSDFSIASRMICEQTLEQFIKYDLKDKSISSRMVYSVEKANESVCLVSDDKGSGMLSTLCCVVWELNKNKIYYTYVGDSRIYKISQTKGFEQLSNDQITLMGMYSNGKPILVNGVPQFRKLISNAIGFKNLVLEIAESEFLEGESLLLCSDGVYEVIDLENDISSVLKSSDFDNSFNELAADIAGKNIDDATLILLRRNDFIISSDSSLPDYIVLSQLIDELETMFRINNKFDIIAIIGKISSLEINLGKNDFSRIMEAWGKSQLFKENDKEINSELFKLRRKL